MNTTKKHPSKTRVEVSIKLTADDLATASEKALARLSADLKIPGFRKGKAPAAAAKKHIPENDLASAALDIAVRSAIPSAFEGTRAISVPEISIDKYVPGQLLEFRATADILPPIKLGDYKKSKIKKPETKVSPAEIDHVLDNIASSFAEKKVANRPAKLTDEVQIDFVGKQKGEPFDGGTAKDFKLTLGSGQFIPGFESGIVGHAPGDQFSLDLAFPKDYHAAALASQKVTFEILLKQVSGVTVPKIDDALAQKAGPFKTLKDLKSDIEANLKAQSEHQSAEEYKNALVDELVKTSDVEAPESLISDQLRFIATDIEQKLKYHHLTEEEFLEQSGLTKAAMEADHRRVATERVKAALVLQTLAAELGIRATDAEITAKITELKEVYKKDPEAIKNLSSPNVLTDIGNRLTIEHTLDALLRLHTK